MFEPTGESQSEETSAPSGPTGAEPSKSPTPSGPLVLPKAPPLVEPSRPTNGLAVASMIVALAGLATGICFLIGVILGHVALDQIRRSGERGESYAKTAITVGWIGTGLTVLVLIVGFLLYAFVKIMSQMS
jgi:hypothetical protein